MLLNIKVGHRDCDCMVVEITSTYVGGHRDHDCMAVRFKVYICNLQWLILLIL